MENKETCASKIYMHREGQQERGRKRSKGTSWREQGGKHGDRKGTRTEAGVGCLKHAIVRIIPKGPCHIYIYMQLGFAAHPWLKRKWEKTPPHEPLRGLMSKNMPMSHGANEVVADVCSWLCLPMRPTVSDIDYADYASLMAQDGSITSFKMRIQIQTSLSV